MGRGANWIGKPVLALSIEKYNLMRATARIATQPEEFFHILRNRERDGGASIRDFFGAR
jgi:hypothetical protein